MYSKLFLLIITWQSFLFSQEKLDSITNFRGIKWGAAPAEVKQLENSEYMQQSKGLGFSSLSFKGSIAGFPARIDYTFRNDSLVEGSYSIENVQSFPESFSTTRNFLSDHYGKPDYANINALNPDSLWTAANPGILYTGPQYFWEFLNCFVCLYCSKFIGSDRKEKTSITILYVPGIKISNYSESRLIPLDSLSLPENLRNRADP